MGNAANCSVTGVGLYGLVVVALKYLALCAALLLSGCFKVELPVYQHHAVSASHKKHVSGAYRVRSGDTLYSIGRRFGLNYKLLARRNHIAYPYTIYKGQRLSLKTVAPRSHKLPVSRKQYKKKTVHKAKAKHVRKKHVRRAKSTRKKTVKRSAAVQSIRWPVAGTLTSHFGRRGSRMHDGIDIGAKEGTPVHAAASGEVVYSNHRLTGYGNLIIIRHRHDLFTAYAHNQRNLVRKGDKVKAGAVIARVGHTGRATGPHLHFEVRRGPTPVDPLVYLPKKK
ncbi:MAG: M23 family metallopeptidase [Mariprofundaceae bacterium]